MTKPARLAGATAMQRSTCVHEAGHAILFVALGVSVSSIEFARGGIASGADVNGSVQGGIEQLSLSSRAHIAVKLAGVAAEAVHGLKDGDWGDSSKRLELFYWRRQRDLGFEYFADDSCREGESDGADYPDALRFAFRECGRSDCGVAARALLESLWRRTVRYLERPEPRAAVLRVAELLFAHEYLYPSLRDHGSPQDREFNRVVARLPSFSVGR